MKNLKNSILLLTILSFGLFEISFIPLSLSSSSFSIFFFYTYFYPLLKICSLFTTPTWGWGHPCFTGHPLWINICGGWGSAGALLERTSVVLEHLWSLTSVVDGEVRGIFSSLLFHFTKKLNSFFHLC